MRRLLLLLICFPLLHAQDTEGGLARPSMRVHGEATISVEPDQAEVDIGVVTQAQTAQAATAQNSAKTNAVLEKLRAVAPSANIKTENFSVNPNFRYPKEGEPTIQGYTANNTIRLLLNDLSRLREVINAALGAGATSVNRLNFTLRSEKEVRARALGEAADQAEAGAQALAGSLRVRLGRILQVEEGQPVIVSPAPEIDVGKAQSTDMSPISPGSIQIHANVNLTYELIQPRNSSARTP